MKTFRDNFGTRWGYRLDQMVILTLSTSYSPSNFVLRCSRKLKGGIKVQREQSWLTKVLHILFLHKWKSSVRIRNSEWPEKVLFSSVLYLKSYSHRWTLNLENIKPILFRLSYLYFYLLICVWVFKNTRISIDFCLIGIWVYKVISPISRILFDRKTFCLINIKIPIS